MVSTVFVNIVDPPLEAPNNLRPATCLADPLPTTTRLNREYAPLLVELWLAIADLSTCRRPGRSGPAPSPITALSRHNARFRECPRSARMGAGWRTRTMTIVMLADAFYLPV
jgi:hypothetical protein